MAPSSRGFAASFASALEVFSTGYHLVPNGPEPISRGSKSGQQEGSGVCVLHSHPTTGQPCFMRTSILRFGIHDLLCDTSCTGSPIEPVGSLIRPTGRQRMVGTRVHTMGAITTRNDPLHEALIQSRLLLSWKQLERVGLANYESKIWQVLERVACVGAWMQRGLCESANQYARKAVESFRPWRDGCPGW